MTESCSSVEWTRGLRIPLRIPFGENSAQPSHVLLLALINEYEK